MLQGKYESHELMVHDQQKKCLGSIGLKPFISKTQKTKLLVNVNEIWHSSGCVVRRNSFRTLFASRRCMQMSYYATLSSSSGE